MNAALPKATLRKHERIKSRKLMEALFRSGAVLQDPPLRITWLPLPQPGVLQVAVGVSARNFKKAVHRNRIKRLLREAYRLQKAPLQQALQQRQQGLALFLLFTGRQLPEYSYLYKKTGQALALLLQHLHATPQNHT
ncbi:MAG: ribonuclease P protein component [Lacibacter sp.]